MGSEFTPMHQLAEKMARLHDTEISWTNFCEPRQSSRLPEMRNWGGIGIHFPPMSTSYFVQQLGHAPLGACGITYTLARRMESTETTERITLEIGGRFISAAQISAEFPKPLTVEENRWMRKEVKLERVFGHVHLSIRDLSLPSIEMPVMYRVNYDRAASDILGRLS